MSRSKHTDPLSIRASRRLRNHRDKRGVGDLGQRRAVGKLLKQLGIFAAPRLRPTTRSQPTCPRIVVQLPRNGFFHPAGKNDILRIFDAVHPDGVYGLRIIELARAPIARRGALPPLGRYYTPGRIRLYEQPRPPWRLPVSLKPQSIRRLQEAGASVTSMAATGATFVHWPLNSLRRFMMEVLVHEIGHHVLQHNHGKRSVRIARTRDHESFAAAFVRARGARLRKMEATVA